MVRHNCPTPQLSEQTLQRGAILRAALGQGPELSTQRGDPLVNAQWLALEGDPAHGVGSRGIERSPTDAALDGRD